MEYRFLGKTGLKVSEVAMGTQTFGWVTDEKEAHQLLDIFIGAGGNLLDSANIYNNGVSEIILGNWIKKQKNRDSLVIATKVFFPVGEGHNDTGLTRKHIFNEIDKSLSRLKVDYIDLYQVHCCDRSTPLEETLNALNDLVQSGKVRYIGASNFTASKLLHALMISKMCGIAPFISLQPEYSLIVRSTEWELIPLCIEEGIGVLAWSPLSGGWLTGKYRKNKPTPQNSRVGRKDRWDDQPEQRESDLTWNVIETLLQIGEQIGKTPSQIALNWILCKSGITAPIIGARTKGQLKENLGCTGWRLIAEDIEKLDNASHVKRPYPYSFIERYTRKRD
ncbi:MAG: aldo/keto reductase [Spirochaetota bacterium]|nr:MAG: aldo/keto reductase [Spirochaetota bacterium]